MRKIVLLFSMALLLFSCDKKEDKKEKINTSEPVLLNKVDTLEATKKEISQVLFTVQIAALENYNEKLATIENIKTYQENGLTKYRLGAFKTYKEARIYRNELGYKYKDAFIQALENDSPIGINKALQP